MVRWPNWKDGCVTHIHSRGKKAVICKVARASRYVVGMDQCVRIYAAFAPVVGVGMFLRTAQLRGGAAPFWGLFQYLYTFAQIHRLWNNAAMTSIHIKIKKLLRRVGTARSTQLVQAGVARVQLSRMVTAGELVRVSRGLYALPNYQGGEHSSLVTVMKRAPNVVFCLLTALRLHGLTTQAPFEAWIAIGNTQHAPRIDYPPLRIVRFSTAALKAGVVIRKVDGVSIRVTSVAKTVADCFKFRNKIGLDVALEALHDSLRAKKASADELWKFAKINRVSNVMRPYMEAVAAL